MTFGTTIEQRSPLFIPQTTEIPRISSGMCSRIIYQVNMKLTTKIKKLTGGIIIDKNFHPSMLSTTNILKLFSGVI